MAGVCHANQAELCDTGPLELADTAQWLAASQREKGLHLLVTCKILQFPTSSSLEGPSQASTGTCRRIFQVNVLMIRV